MCCASIRSFDAAYVPILTSMVRMSECECNPAPLIQLSPFIHQVGGHSSMFQYDRDTVCKLLAPAEYEFYQSLPDSLKAFTPEFRGSVTVQYYEDELGFIKLFARPHMSTPDSPCSSGEHEPSPTSEQSTSDGALRKCVQLRCSKDGHVDYSNGLGMDIVNYEKGKTTMAIINPWGLQMCKKQVEKLHRQLIGDENGTVSQKYILLENVTARFRNPCILDLKMGRRQYADVDSDKKRQSKIQKCEQSTSSKLGVRLCGMQVYQVDSDRYIFTDKYCGRVLTVDEFRSSLVQFLDNGRARRRDVLPEIIERLESLHGVISTLLRYRFYSGSLLIVYDGSAQSNLIDVRMIDFANTISGASGGGDDAPNHHVGPDKGYLFGLECLLGIFRAIMTDGESQASDVSMNDADG